MNLQKSLSGKNISISIVIVSSNYISIIIFSPETGTERSNGFQYVLCRAGGIYGP